MEGVLQALLHSPAAAFELPVRALKGLPPLPEPQAAPQGGAPAASLATPMPMQQAPRRGGLARGGGTMARGGSARGHITVSIGGRSMAQRGRGSAPR